MTPETKDPKSQKTRVVTFRVTHDLFAQIEEAKRKSGLSNADLIKLGAGITLDEVKSKLDRVSGLENRLHRLRVAVEEKEQALDQLIREEKERRLQELDIEMNAFKLFDRGWQVEQVSHKLGTPMAAIIHYLEEWGKERGDKQLVEKELIKNCLGKHLERLRHQKIWVGSLPGRYSRKDMENLEEQIDYCRHLLTVPEKVSEVDRQFLIAEYASKP